MPAGTTWGLVRVHFWSCTSHSAPPSALPSQVCVSVCACPPVSVHVWPSLESLCLSSYYMAEKHRDQTLRRELHKRHSGARTPCFHSAASRYWKTDLRVGKWERKSGRRADVCVCVCVCMCLREIHSAAWHWPSNIQLQSRELSWQTWRTSPPTDSLAPTRPWL